MTKIWMFFGVEMNLAIIRLKYFLNKRKNSFLGLLWKCKNACHVHRDRREIDFISTYEALMRIKGNWNTKVGFLENTEKVKSFT